MLEALTLGLPVVATDVGGINEVFGEAQDAVLVPPSEPELLAKAIGALARDPERRKAMTRAAVARQPDFAVEQNGSRDGAPVRRGPRPLSTTAPDIALRPMRPEDRAGVLLLLSATQRWLTDDLFDQFFAWKHEHNSFGPSPAWVATSEDRIVGFRTFVRWEFEHPDGRVRRAVRAVDTATHPDFQGQKIFSRLTLLAIEQLRPAGIDFVFNTPNDKSRPGYLKMGWREVGRLPAAVRPAGVGGISRMLRSRVPADRWSQPSTAGDPALDVLDGYAIDRLLSWLAPRGGCGQRRSADYLRWRYGFVPFAISCATRSLVIRRTASRCSACGHAAPQPRPPVRRDRAGRRRSRGPRPRADRRPDVSGRLRHPAGRICAHDRLPALAEARADLDVARVAEAEPPAALDWQLQLGDVELF